MVISFIKPFIYKDYILILFKKLNNFYKYNFNLIKEFTVKIIIIKY